MTQLQNVEEDDAFLKPHKHDSNLFLISNKAKITPYHVQLCDWNTIFDCSGEQVLHSRGT